jgi:hypothetical protein
MSTGAVGARRLVPNFAEEPPPPPSSGDSPPHPFSCSIGPPPSPSLHPHAAELTGSTVDCRTTLTVECRTTLTASERRHISPSPPPRHRAATSVSPHHSLLAQCNPWHPLMLKPLTDRHLGRRAAAPAPVHCMGWLVSTRARRATRAGWPGWWGHGAWLLWPLLAHQAEMAVQSAGPRL